MTLAFDLPVPMQGLEQQVTLAIKRLTRQCQEGMAAAWWNLPTHPAPVAVRAVVWPRDCGFLR